MKRGHLITGIVSFFLCAMLVQGAAAGIVERSIEPAEPTTSRVVLTLPAETVARIVEVLPPGTEVSEVSLPPDQYRVEGTTLFLAVIGEREVSYLMHGPPDSAGAIRGTWTDYLSGEEGTVGVHGDGMQGAEVSPAVPLTAVTPKAGPPLPLLLAMAGVAFVGAARCRLRGREGQ
jgi:hypothetical protein